MGTSQLKSLLGALVGYSACRSGRSVGALCSVGALGFTVCSCRVFCWGPLVSLFVLALCSVGVRSGFLLVQLGSVGAIALEGVCVCAVCACPNGGL